MLTFEILLFWQFIWWILNFIKITILTSDYPEIKSIKNIILMSMLHFILEIFLFCIFSIALSSVEGHSIGKLSNANCIKIIVFSFVCSSFHSVEEHENYIFMSQFSCDKNYKIFL